MEDSTQKVVQVAAVMTAPRHEIVWARTQIEKALKPFGIPLHVSGGVFYGQCMQIMLSRLIDEGKADYALTIDFDSVFTSDDVMRLINVIAHNEHIDALCGIQAKRGKSSILGTNGKEEDLVWDGQPVKLQSGHFGLTIIDLQKLATVAKPWFLAVPDEHGEWTDGKVDDDVYFWRRWRECGLSLYMDPGVRLGHMQEMVTMLDENMQIKHVYPKEWVEMSEMEASPC